MSDLIEEFKKNLLLEEFKKKLDGAVIYDVEAMEGNKLRVLLTPNHPLEIEVPEEDLEAIYDRGIDDFKNRLIETVNSRYMNDLYIKDIETIALELKNH